MGVNDWIQIGSRIKAIRTAKGIKQNEMALKLGIPKSTYANYENEHREPSSEMIVRIANILEVPIPELIASKTDHTKSHIRELDWPDLTDPECQDQYRAAKAALIGGTRSTLESFGYDVHFSDTDNSVLITSDATETTTALTRAEYIEFLDAIKKAIEFELYKRSNHK